MILSARRATRAADKWIGILHSFTLIGVLTLFVVFCLGTIWSYGASNVGLLIVLHKSTVPLYASSDASARLEALFEKATSLHSANPGARRGLGFLHWMQGRDLQALTEWQYISMTAEDYIAFGKQAENVNESLRWYAMAERLDLSHPELWLVVGQICQRNQAIGHICNRFLIHNGGNLLVDPTFFFDGRAWSFNRREGAEYVIVECPGIPDKRCAQVRIDALTSRHGTGWQQCLTLVSGQRYRFSVWIKTETAGRWIPTYYQGSVDGMPNGYSLDGSHSGSHDWRYWEQEFTFPDFDRNRACFHPVRLLDVGKSWFHSAEVRVVK